MESEEFKNTKQNLIKYLKQRNKRYLLKSEYDTVFEMLKILTGFNKKLIEKEKRRTKELFEGVNVNSLNRSRIKDIKDVLNVGEKKEDVKVKRKYQFHIE